MVERAPSRLRLAWQKDGTSLIVILLAIAIMVTITGNGNSWEGGRVEQVTNDAYARGDSQPAQHKSSGPGPRGKNQRLPKGR